MTNVGILWVVLSPYCTGLAVAWSPSANRLVSRHLRASRWIGWLGLATLFAAVFVVGGPTGLIVAAASAPFVGLAFWTTASGSGDDNPPPGPPDDEPPEDTIEAEGVRLKGPRRARPTGHREPRRTRPRAPTR
jgi:hypothetical protein